MKKNEFIKAVAKTADMTQNKVSEVLISMLNIIRNELKNEREVNITGFGAFKISKRSARNGSHPKTGVAIKIPAIKIPVFKAGRILKQEIRGTTKI